jgi:hypothetical protein
MSDRLLVGDLVTFNETNTIDDSQPQIGVILKIDENDEVDVAVPNSNSTIRYLPKIADISSIQKVTRQMVTNGTITQDQYDKGREFEIEMEDEMVTGTNDNVIKRATGGSKRRRRGKRSSKRKRRSSQKRRRRTMRK